MISLFRRKAAVAASPPAAPAVQAFPAGINIADQEKIEHAKYRLDAIARHCEQAGAVPAQTAEEFRSEAWLHAANLATSGAITRAEGEAMLARIEAAITAAGA